MSSRRVRWERLLSDSRVVVLVAVVASLLLAVAAFVVGAADTVSVIAGLVDYLDPGVSAAERDTLRGDLVGSIVKAVDTFLIGAILLVVAIGLYELFIRRIDPTESPAAVAQAFSIKSLDELKDRISRLALLILTVEFLGMALRLSTTTALDLLYLAIGIFLIAAAVYLGGKHGSG